VRRGAQRWIFGAALAVVLLGGDGGRARADLFGSDIPILSGILTQAISELGTLGSMLDGVQSQVAALDAMLAQLSGGSFSAVLATMQSTAPSYADLTGNVASIDYTLQSVSGQFQALYDGRYAGMPIGRFDALYGRWEDQVLEAAQVAARSQAVLSMLHDNATEAAAILASSQASGGQVAQLQAVVQMLGLMQAQNGAVIQSLATTGRVLTSEAARSAAEGQLSREKKRRHLAGYRYRGTPVPTMTTLP
jgi:conjugal transfer/entry exclusion protein